MSIRISFMGLVGAVFWSAYEHSFVVNVSLDVEAAADAHHGVFAAGRVVGPTFGCLLLARSQRWALMGNGRLEVVAEMNCTVSVHAVSRRFHPLYKPHLAALNSLLSQCTLYICYNDNLRIHNLL